MGKATCKRCGAYPRLDEGLCALSLVDQIKICSDCGIDESYENFLGRLTPRSEWPMEVGE